LEILAVLCIAVIPDVWSAVYVLLWQPREQPSFALQYVSLALRALFVSIPVMFVMHRSHTPARAFGIVRVSARDVAVGASIAVLLLGLSRWLYFQLDIRSASQDPFAVPEGVPQYCLLVAALALNAFAEELVVRGYLITRLEMATASLPMALLLSSALFAAYHVYHGPATIQVFLAGMLLGIAFLVWRRLWPVVIAHFLWDVYVVYTHLR